MLFSALLKDGTTRLLILHPKFDLHTPEYLWEELERNRDFLIQKSGTTAEAFEILLRSMQQRIRNVPLEVIRPHVPEASRRLETQTDPDVAYLAAALAINATVWTHDKPFSSRAKVPVVKTAEMLAKLYQ